MVTRKLLWDYVMLSWLCNNCNDSLYNVACVLAISNPHRHNGWFRQKLFKVMYILCMYDAAVACLEGKEMLLASWHTLVASSVKFTSMLVNSSVGVISYNLYWNHTLTIHFIVTFVMLFLHWASIRLKFLGGFGAVWIKTEIMYVVFQCEHSYIQVHVVTLVHYNIISKTPDTLQLLYYSNAITLATCYK